MTTGAAVASKLLLAVAIIVFGSVVVAGARYVARLFRRLRGRG